MFRTDVSRFNNFSRMDWNAKYEDSGPWTPAGGLPAL
jgi:hypothetical protein